MAATVKYNKHKDHDWGWLLILLTLVAVGIVVFLVVWSVTRTNPGPNPPEDENLRLVSRYIDPEQIRFDNIPDHDVLGNNFIDTSAKVMSNLYYSSWNLARDIVGVSTDPGPVSADPYKPLNDQTSKVMVTTRPYCTYPNFGDREFFAYVNTDPYGIESPAIDTTYNSGADYRDQITCATDLPTPERRVWAYNANGVSACQCIGVFTGCECQNELHSSRYYAIAAQEGLVGLDYDVISTHNTERISFSLNPGINLAAGGSDTPCTRLCDETEGCEGVVISSPNGGLVAKDGVVRPASYLCSLLTKVINVKVEGERSVPYQYDPYITPAMLLKLRTTDNKTGRLRFKDRVFATSSGLPLRYWNEGKYVSGGASGNADTILRTRPELGEFYQIELNYRPVYFVNDTGGEGYPARCDIIVSNEIISNIQLSEPGALTPSNTVIIYQNQGIFQPQLPDGWTRVWVAAMVR